MPSFSSYFNDLDLDISLILSSPSMSMIENLSLDKTESVVSMLVAPSKANTSCSVAPSSMAKSFDLDSMVLTSDLKIFWRVYHILVELS